MLDISEIHRNTESNIRYTYNFNNIIDIYKYAILRVKVDIELVLSKNDTAAYSWSRTFKWGIGLDTNSTGIESTIAPSDPVGMIIGGTHTHRDYRLFINDNNFYIPQYTYDFEYFGFVANAFSTVDVNGTISLYGM